MDDRARRLQVELASELAPYRQLLTSFVAGEISADAFEIEYLEMYKNDPRLPSDPVFNIVDGFFGDVDAYVSDPGLRDPANGDIGPEELRERARALLRRAGHEV